MLKQRTSVTETLIKSNDLISFMSLLQAMYKVVNLTTETS